MDKYIVWSRSFELTEPALFYTSLFLATGIPVSNGQLSIDKALWLRGQAVKALNEALDDPKRAISNAVISAVGKIALHEHIYGDRQATHRIHRPAQQRYALPIPRPNLTFLLTDIFQHDSYARRHRESRPPSNYPTTHGLVRRPNGSGIRHDGLFCGFA
jgi:hypothetical protein